MTVQFPFGPAEIKSKAEFKTHVKDWSRNDLQRFYESLPGAPPAKRLRNRPYAIGRIWEVLSASAPKEEKKVVEGNGSHKRDGILLALRKPGGVTLDSLCADTGWQRHTMRGFLSTLRSESGLAIETVRDGKTTTYSLNTV